MSSQKLLLTTDNWRLFHAFYLDRSHTFGDAGKMLRERVTPTYDDPIFTASEVDGEENEIFVYDQTAGWGRQAWLADRTAVRKDKSKFKDDNQNCLADLLSYCSTDVKDKLKAKSEYEALSITENLLGIFLLLETIGIARGAGSQSLTSAWSDYHKCAMIFVDPKTKEVVTMTYDRYCVSFKDCVKRINQLQEHPLDVTGVSTKFLEGCDLTTHTFADLKRMEFLSLDAIPDFNAVLTTISKARDVQSEQLRKIVPKSVLPTHSRSEEKAHVTKPVSFYDRKPPSSDAYQCNNCGITGPKHEPGKCDKPATTCATCGKQWHMTQFHERWELYRKNRKSKAKIARVAEVVTMFMAKVKGPKVSTSAEKDTCHSRIIADTGATAFTLPTVTHLGKPTELLPGAIIVEGFAEGLSLEATHEGIVTLQHLQIRGLVVPGAESLFPLPEVARCQGSFYGDEDGLLVFDSKQDIVRTGSLLATFLQDKDGLWSCPTTDFFKSPETLRACAIHLSADEKKRAIQARQLHVLLNHPGDQALGDGLDRGTFMNCHLTSRDVKNARDGLGHCDGCTQGKMKAQPNPPSTSLPATDIGAHFHVDTVPYASKTVGGFEAAIIGVDEKSDFCIAANLVRESAQHVNAGLQAIVSTCNSFGHKVLEISSDRGTNFVAQALDIGVFGIRMNTTIPGQAEKRAERKIQTIKGRERAVKAGLPYELPSKLDGELRANVIASLNMLPTYQSNGQSPKELFTNEKPDLKKMTDSPFGACGIFKDYEAHKDDPNHGEYGIVCGWHANGVRAFFPGRDKVLIKGTFDPVRVIPPEWGWKSKVPARSIMTPDAIAAESRNVHIQSGTDIKCAVSSMISKLEDDYANSFDDPLDVAVPDDNVSTVALVDYVARSPEPTTVSESVIPNVIAVSESDCDISHRESGAATATVDEASNAMTADKALDTDVMMDESESINYDDKLPTLSTRLLGAVPEIEADAAEVAEPRRSRVTSQSSNPYEKHYRTYARMAKTSVSSGRRFVKIHANVAVHQERHLRPERAREAIEAELLSLMKMDVMTPVDLSAIQLCSQDCILPGHMFTNDKFSSDNGTYEKTKSRFCAGGNHKDPTTYGYVSSDTANAISIAIMVKAAAAANDDIEIFDVKCAFLHPRIPAEAPKIIIRMDPKTAKIFVALFPQHMHLISTNGWLYFLLRAYIYGLPEAGKKWNDHLAAFLKTEGFQQSRMDPCCFIKYVCDTEYLKLAVHVDDILATGKGLLLRQFETSVRAAFVGYTKQDGNKFSHLGVTYSRDRSALSISMSQTTHIDDLLERMGMTDCTGDTMPYGSNLMEDTDDSPDVCVHDYLSLVMSLLYIARMTRPELLFCVGYLASKGTKPCLKDWEKAKRVTRYLRHTRDYARVLRGSDTTPSFMGDASHAIHKDARGHASIELLMGKSFVYAQCGKLKANTIHSTESETLCLRDTVTFVPYVIEFFKEMHLQLVLPVTVYQDNTSTIHWVNHGGKFKRAKHVLVAIHYVKDFIDSGMIRTEHLETAEMHADLNTKVHGPEVFHKFAQSYYK